MNSAESLEERVSIASRVLTEMTRNVGIAAALPASSQELEHLELIALSDRRVLMIVATRDKMVRNRVVTLDRELLHGRADRSSATTSTSISPAGLSRRPVRNCCAGSKRSAPPTTRCCSS